MPGMHQTWLCILEPSLTASGQKRDGICCLTKAQAWGWHFPQRGSRPREASGQVSPQQAWHGVGAQWTQGWSNGYILLLLNWAVGHTANKMVLSPAWHQRACLQVLSLLLMHCFLPAQALNLSISSLISIMEAIMHALYITGEGKGNPLQYFCLENPMDRGAWCPWGRKESDTTEQLDSLTGIRLVQGSNEVMDMCNRDTESSPNANLPFFHSNTITSSQ